RADLIDLVAEGARAAGVKIRLLQHVLRVEPGTPARIELDRGVEMHADLVVGADGLHSATRAALNGTIAPFFTGQVAWRAVVPAEQGARARPPEAWVHMGPRRHVVSYPLREGTALNIVAVQERAAWQAESWSQEDDPETLRRTFADFGGEVREMLACVERVHLWGLFRHPVAPMWHGEGVVLLGDAAHPTLPFMAQGASLALEDAWVLSEALSLPGRLATRLAAYQTRREGRARRVVEAASSNAWKYHLALPPLRWAAHAALRAGGALIPGRMIRQYDWLYGHDVTAEG
ncbi:MAG: FAD-dependent monooxygenase, partial [Roseovarius sp.]